MPSSATFKRPPRPSRLDATILRHHLIGTKLPAELTIDDTDGDQLRLGGPTAALAAYLFPGSSTSPAHGTDTPLADAEEHRSFRDLHDRLTALELTVVGVSSQPEEKLREAITANRLAHPLASDTGLRLAEALELPTFPAGGARVYERLTLLIIAGRISEVFYPVPTPGHHAEEVLQRLDGR